MRYKFFFYYFSKSTASDPTYYKNTTALITQPNNYCTLDSHSRHIVTPDLPT